MIIKSYKVAIRNWIKAEGLTRTQVAAMAGLNSEATIRTIMRDDWSPTANTLEAVLNVLPLAYHPKEFTPANDDQKRASKGQTPKGRGTPKEKGGEVMP